MTDRLRLGIFLVAGPVFLGLYCYAALNLPPWGQYRGPYGDMIARLAVYERHATDTVNAINYDYRGFDTLGEEFILFTAAIGVTMLLRREKDVPTSPVGKVADRPPLSEAVRAVMSPGLAHYRDLWLLHRSARAAHSRRRLPGRRYPRHRFGPGLSCREHRRLQTHHVSCCCGSGGGAGASSYALIGVMPLLIGLPFLTNILPLGTTGDVFSAGNIALISACVGVEVTAAFLLVIYTYLEEIVTGEIPAE